MKALKKSIIVCGLSLVLCVGLLMGTTFAWFTDTVTNSGNIIQARKDGEFTSVDDLKKRASLTTTVIESLREHGCLDNLQENDQIALFS